MRRPVKIGIGILLVVGWISCGTAFVPADAQQTAATGAGDSAASEGLQWQTVGLRQANTMGGGQASIPKSGKLRVFVLMGQSNMQGSGRARELQPPYTQKHERIRIWANGRWEYLVPTQRFGPEVSFSHQLATFWPNDTIGIIKVCSGGTGIRGFEKNWSADRARLTFDHKKGSLYKDLMNAVAEAKRISNPEFCGFFWKQAAADGTRKTLAFEYYDTLTQLVSDLRSDLNAPSLPVFIPNYMNDKDLLKFAMAKLSEDDLQKVQNPAGKELVDQDELLQSFLNYMRESSWSQVRNKANKRPYIAVVIAAQNRAGREMPNVITIHPGKLPTGADGVHYTSAGYLTLGKFTAAAVEDFYKQSSAVLPQPL
jgi:hypothetical protein